MIGLRNSVSGAVMGLLSLVACGGGSGGPANAPDPASSSITLTLSSEGVSPKTSSVSGNGSVIITITNSDSVAHQLTSNPDPQLTDCPELNTPMLAPGDQFTAAISNRGGTCGFEDLLNPADSNFQGTITVTISPTTMSGGY